MSRVLVVGGAGYVGSIVVEQLAAAGYDVTVFDNLSQGHREAVDPSIPLVIGDLADIALLDRTFQAHSFDAVMHFAAETLVATSMTDPHRYFYANDVLGLGLLETARRHGVKKFVFSSTSATYGEPVSLPMKESQPTRPINAYGLSKLMFEQMLAWYRQAYGFHVVSFRYFNAAGASERFGECHHPETHLIPLILEAAAGKRPTVEIYGTDYATPDGTCIRDFTHVRDIAQAHILGLRQIEQLSQTVFNLGSESGHSIRQVIEAARRITGRAIALREGPRRPGDVDRMTADSSQARKRLGWAPQFSRLETILETAWAWHKKYPHGYSHHPAAQEATK